MFCCVVLCLAVLRCVVLCFDVFNVIMFAFYRQAIAGIAESWEQITLDIGPYKDRGHFRLKYELITQDK